MSGPEDPRPTDEQLAGMLGGLPRNGAGSSKTIDDIPGGGRPDTDTDF